MDKGQGYVENCPGQATLEYRRSYFIMMLIFTNATLPISEYIEFASKQDDTVFSCHFSIAICVVSRFAD